jgi:hypothetical protein
LVDGRDGDGEGGSRKKKIGLHRSERRIGRRIKKKICNLLLSGKINKCRVQIPSLEKKQKKGAQAKVTDSKEYVADES